MDKMVVLQHKHPEIAEYLQQWSEKNESRTFDFKDENDQADFVEAVQDMARHIATVSTNASLVTVVSVDGVNTLYVNVTPSIKDADES